jgi:hypothetical protein
MMQKVHKAVTVRWDQTSNVPLDKTELNCER